MKDLKRANFPTVCWVNGMSWQRSSCRYNILNIFGQLGKAERDIGPAQVNSNLAVQQLGGHGQVVQNGINQCCISR